MSTIRKIMVGLLLFGVAATAVGAGTFATFTATTSNPGNTFSVGTLVLSNQVGSGDVCFSAGGDGGVDLNVNECDVLFDGLTNAGPGQPPTYAYLTLRNEGTLDAAALKYHLTQCLPGDAPGAQFQGQGNPCTVLAASIQEYTDESFETPVNACVFPAAAAPCSAGAIGTVPTELTDVGGLNSGQARYFAVGLGLAASAGNEHQGRAATFSLTWQIEQ